MSNFKFKDSYAMSYKDTIGWRVKDEIWILNTYRRSRTTCRHITQLKRILAERGSRYIELETDLSFKSETFSLEVLDYVCPRKAENYKALIELGQLGIVDLNIVWARFVAAYLTCLRMGNEQEQKKVCRVIKKLNLESYRLAELELIKVLTEKRKEEGPCVI